MAAANRTAEQVRSEAQARGQVEYDRISANAENEVALARRRAVEEAARRMGELVLDVVERIIGREVDAATHRDLIDEAVAALNADAAGARRRPVRGASSTPASPATPPRCSARSPRRLGTGLAGELESVDELVASGNVPSCARRSPTRP